jgi:hypothetical protein
MWAAAADALPSIKGGTIRPYLFQTKRYLLQLLTDPDR